MNSLTSTFMTADNLPNSNFLPIDFNFLNNPQYADLSIEAIFLHALYTQRMTCSIHNSLQDGSWLDEEKIPFIYYSNAEVAEVLRISERKVTTLRNQLAELGLIKVVRHGLKNYRIYVANPTAPAEGTVMKFTFKNYRAPQTVDKSRDAKSASTSSQNLPISTSKQLVKTTNITSETGVAPKKLQHPVDKEAALLAGLQARYAHLIPETVFMRFLPFCDNRYLKAKKFVDLIFKAKYVANQQFIKAGLPPEAEALTFENNPYFKNGLADAIAKACEQIYRYGNVSQPEAFFFSFLKGFFVEKTRQFLVDSYEVNDHLAATLERVENFQKRKVLVKSA